VTAPVQPAGPRFPNPDPWTGDPAQVCEEARQVLRLATTDPDIAGRLMPLSYAISDLVRSYLAEALPFDDLNQTAPIPEPVHQACITALVEAYRRKDAPFGITGAWNSDGVAIRVTRDWLDAVQFALQPYRQGFGIG